MAAISGSLLAAPLAAEAQQMGRVFRIGILGNLRTGKPDLWGIFIEGLRDLGWVEGKNMVIEWRISEGRYERLPALAAELAALKPDVIVVPANQNAVAVQQVTRTIPVVMIGVTDPVGSGLVASFARPGGNMTGLAASVSPEIGGKWMELLKAAVPRMSRVAILWNPGNPASALQLKEARSVAQALKVQVQALEARGPEDFQSALLAHRGWHVQPSCRATREPRGEEPAADHGAEEHHQQHSHVVPDQQHGPLATRRHLRRQDPEGRQARRPAHRAADEVRAGDQLEDRQG